MGIAERREREKNERRKLIVTCAKELIIEHGPERVSMDDIAKKAELSKATVYLYFSGKEILLNEIRDETAKVFINRLASFMNTNLTGLNTIKHFWHSYIELFGNSDDMIIAYKIHSHLNSGLPFISADTNISNNVTDIINALKNLINKCKTEGIFDPDLDPDMATRLLLSMFSNSIENAARLPESIRKSPMFINEMTKTFQIFVYGFAKEDVSRSLLDISVM